MVREFENMFKGKQGNSDISGVKTNLEKLKNLKNYGEVQSFRTKSATSHSFL